MTPDALLRQRQLLQEQLQRQEIDQATYGRMLAFLQALEGPSAAATPSNETPTMPTATLARTAGDATPAAPRLSTALLSGGERPRPSPRPRCRGPPFETRTDRNNGASRR